MTPKEKAKELFEKMYEYAIFDEAAKQCALIAVDEILLNTKVYTLSNDKITYHGYWHAVKQEIENL